jgi:hypothetical protein
MLTALAYYSTPKCRNGRGNRADGVTYRSYLAGLTETLDGDAREARRLIREWSRTWPLAFRFNPRWAYGNAPGRAPSPLDLYEEGLPDLRAAAADNPRLGRLLDEVGRGRRRAEDRR